MKKLFWIVTLLASLSIASGQKSIDALFNRYAGRDGFTTITINGNLLKLARLLDDDDEENPLPGDITEIRILVQEDKEMQVENFYDLVIRDIYIKDYEEFMRVKESDQDLRMLVRSDGNIFKEFLLVAGGDDNFIIQVKGNMTYKEARKFSSDIKNGHGLNLCHNIID
ncbi:MAG: DUF4252 domain-containing protein [Bacteroidales bacterium]|nr:DUF4252 domain-containing protein [Bacteroidales bacterium]